MTVGFLVAVELDSTFDSTQEALSRTIGDSLAYRAGVIDVDVEVLGEIEVIPEEN